MCWLAYESVWIFKLSTMLRLERTTALNFTSRLAHCCAVLAQQRLSKLLLPRFLSI